MAEPQVPQLKNERDVPDLSGTMVGRFAIRSRLGAGGMGEVYLADDTRLKRPVALKRIAPQLRADESYRRYFVKEAERASALIDPHIASVYDVLEENGETFLVMEYVEGQTLRQRLEKPLDLKEFLPLVVQCAEALVAAHEKGIVHRDIKPENLMVTPKGQLKILDFGVAKRVPRTDETTAAASTASTAAPFAGTPAYMAPEVLLEKKIDGRADIFSLGVILYEVLAGRHPFRTDTFTATSDRILHAVPIPLAKLNPEVPAELERIVAKMLAKDPAERHATARDLLVDLRALRHERQPGTYRPETSTAMRWLRTAALTVVLVTLFTAAAPSVYRVLESVLWPIPDEKNVVVLPFEAIGGDDEDQAYADGLMQTLTAKATTLTDTYNLQVTPASDVIEKGVRSAAEARTEFGANLVVEGSIHRVGATVRINCNLVDTVTRSNLRTRTITEDATDFFALEDSVVIAVLEMLRVEVESKEQTVLAAYGTSEPTAHKLYLQGRGYLLNYDKPENVESAIRNFQEALVIDPAYAQAHAGLGEAYWRKYEGTQESQWVGPARQNCERASGLSPDLAAAHICLGTLYTGTGRYQEAEGEFRRALEAESTSDAAYRGLALAQHRLGKLDQAEKTYRRAIALRPGYWAGYSWMGAFYASQARYQEAAEQFKQAVALTPDNARAHSSLGGVYIFMGKYEEAATALGEAIELSPTDAAAYENLGYVYLRLRRFTDAVAMFEQAFALGSQDYITCGNLASAYYWAPGQRTKAREMYERAIRLGQERLNVNPKDANVHILLANYNAMLGRRTQALSLLQHALSLRPNEPEFLLMAAVVHNQFGERAKALAWVERAMARGYSAAEIRTAIELDNLRNDPNFQALIRSK